MAQWDMSSLALYVLGPQEASQWDLRSVYAPSPLLCCSVFSLSLLSLSCRSLDAPAIGLLALVPGLNLLAFWFLAFKPWPTDKKPANTAN
jgi:hypothetical protein